MWIYRGLAMFLCGAVAACASPMPLSTNHAPESLNTPAVAYTGPLRALTPAEQAAIAKAIKNNLKDADSAKFKWTTIRAVSAGSETPYCALVNAKNSMGGYVGFTAFLVMVGSIQQVRFVGMDGGSEFGLIGITDRCRKYGLDPTLAN